MKNQSLYEISPANIWQCVPKKIKDDLSIIRSAFEDNNKTIRLVGGAVRDMLLNKTPNNYDLITDATPEQMMEIGEKNGLKPVFVSDKQGTITFNINDEKYEISTLKTESDFPDSCADVEHHDHWAKDAAHRDLTINAMSLDLDGRLYDYFDGQQHLKNEVIQFVGDVDCRIQEDYLRILRYFRFLGKTNNPKMNKNIMNAIKYHINGLEEISGEKIWRELKQILLSPNAVKALKIMCKTHLPFILNISCEKIHRFSQLKSYTKNPITLYSILTTSGFTDIKKNFKISNEEQSLLQLILNRKFKGMTMKELKLGMVLNKISRLQAVESSIALNCLQDARDLEKWNIPLIPICVDDLIQAGLKPGKQTDELLTQIYQEWANSNFKLTKEQLLANHVCELPRV